MQPYSRDLRQRIVDCYDRGDGSIRGLAERCEDSVFMESNRERANILPSSG